MEQGMRGGMMNEASQVALVVKNLPSTQEV